MINLLDIPGFDWFFDVSRLSTFVVSVAVIIYASFRSLGQTPIEFNNNEKSHRQITNNDDDDGSDWLTLSSRNEKHLPISAGSMPLSQRQTLDSTQAILLPIGASLTLIVMFYFFDSIQIAITMITALVSWVSFAFLIVPLCRVLLCNLADRIPFRKFSTFSKCINHIKFVHFISFFISFFVVVLWVKTDHWLLMNALGLGLCVSFISIVHLPSLKVSFLLLTGLLIYDIFWVFFSAYIFRSNVMLHVATHAADNPMFMFFENKALPAIGTTNRLHPGNGNAFFKQSYNSSPSLPPNPTVKIVENATGLDSNYQLKSPISINSDIHINNRFLKNIDHLSSSPSIDDNPIIDNESIVRYYPTQEKLKSNGIYNAFLLSRMYQRHQSILYNVRLNRDRLTAAVVKESLSKLDETIKFSNTVNDAALKKLNARQLQNSHSIEPYGGEGINNKEDDDINLENINVHLQQQSSQQQLMDGKYKSRQMLVSALESHSGYTQTLSLPVKLLFPSSKNSGHFSMLGLGDIVMPGLLICFLLRYDTFLRRQQKLVKKLKQFYRPRLKFNTPFSNTTHNIVNNKININEEEFVNKQMYSSEKTAGRFLKSIPFTERSPHCCPQKQCGKKNNNQNTLLGFPDDNVELFETFPAKSDLPNFLDSCYYSHPRCQKTYHPFSRTSKISVVFRKICRLKYFTVALFGYLTGLITATFISEAFKAPQPALMYLVPFTLCPTIVIAYWKGELKKMWHQPFS